MVSSATSRALLFGLTVTLGCSGGESEPDAGRGPDVGVVHEDAAPMDARMPPEAGVVMDAETFPDAEPPDVGFMDAETFPDAEVEPPFGLESFVYNTSCVVETVDGDGVITVTATLSDTGCYSDILEQTPAPGLQPFDIRSTLWTDGAKKRRFFALPPDTKIGFAEVGAWTFPAGTILMKEFIIELEVGNPATDFIMETRFFVNSGRRWRGYVYVWNDEGTDAHLIEGEATGFYEVNDGGEIRTHRHDFPSRTQCLRCHPIMAGTVLGLQTPAMNRVFDFDGVTDNQIRAYDHVGLFDPPVDVPLSELSAMPNPEDETADLTDRARSYIHANCAHCHQPGGSAVSGSLDLRYQVPLIDTAICSTVEPGAPERSEFWTQMVDLEMPPIAIYSTDPRGDVVSEWIGDMNSCP